VAPLAGVASLLERALRNYVETFPLFAATVLIAHPAGRHDWMTEWGVQLYFWGRVGYLALYTPAAFFWRARLSETSPRRELSPYSWRWSE
jgi:uncharacterized MAPEG superfamily protein